MNIILPNGKKRKIEDGLSKEEKIELVREMTEEFEEEILIGWETLRVKYFLDALSNYLCWHKEEDEKGLEDKDITSKRKEERANGLRKNKIIPFSYVDKASKQKIGIGGEDIE